MLKLQGDTHLLVVIGTEGAVSNDSLGERDKFQLFKAEFFMSPGSF